MHCPVSNNKSNLNMEINWEALREKGCFDFGGKRGEVNLMKSSISIHV